MHYDYYVGLDVSLQTVAVCVIDKGGKRVFERSVDCAIDDISQCFEALPNSKCALTLNQVR
ncbi:MAG: hypothetical protein ACSHWZ_20150 [Sulfitobacter sp.]